MKKKRFITGVIIIVAVLAVISTRRTYYSTPEEALTNWDSDFKDVIDTVRMQNQIVMFYITKYGDFCDAEFINKETFWKDKWKVVSSGKLPPIKNIDPSVTAPIYMGATNQRNPHQVLYGVTRSAKAETIRINGKTPTFESFEANGQIYTLWYIVGTDELYIDKVKITSD